MRLLITTMTPRLKTLAIVAPLALAAAGGAHAQDVFTFSGFGTLSGVRTNTDDAEFVASRVQPVGAKKSFDFEVDSKVGLQADLRFGKQFSATLLVLAKRDADDKFAAAAERGFLKYSYQDAFSVRAGRIALPLFMIVDSRDVGFAHPGVRLPVEVYGAFPISSVDGADLTYRERLGSTTFVMQALGGRFKQDLPPMLRNTEVEGEAIAGFDVAGENGPFTLRAGVYRAKLTVASASTATLVAALRAQSIISPLPGPLADKIEIKDDAATFYGVGASFDNGTVLFRSEYTKLATEGDAAYNWNSSYATFAVRLGKWQPSATYSTIKPDVTMVNTIAGIATLAPLPAQVNTFLAANRISQKTMSYALRYDAYKNVAAKVQVDQVQADRTANLFVNRRAAFDGSATVYTLALDVKF